MGEVAASFGAPAQGLRLDEPKPSGRSLRSLDLFAFFVADVQTGFGPFISVYLTANAWTQADIGLALALHSLAGMACQMPGGALIDAARSVRRVAGFAVVLLSASALVIAARSGFLAVSAGLVGHAAASCVIGPAIAAISLGLVGYARLGERLGRNARFLALGNGLAAAAMGAVGYFLSSQAIFLFTAVLGAPTLLALARINRAEIDPARARGASGGTLPDGTLAGGTLAGGTLAGGTLREGAASGLAMLAGNRPLLLFCAAMALFQFANAAMLPIAASRMAIHSSGEASVFVGVGVIAPQFVVALTAPFVGRAAERRGRRPVLLIGFGALVLRGGLFALIPASAGPAAFVAVQCLDGVSAAVLGVLAPLIAADVARGAGHFNLAQGAIGVSVGVGASISTVLAGFLFDGFGPLAAFAGLAGIAVCACLFVAAAMPETGPQR